MNIRISRILATAFLTVSLMGAKCPHDLCKSTEPPKDTKMPEGKTCATLCNISTCPNCCGHTTKPGSKADQKCRDACAGSTDNLTGYEVGTIVINIPSGIMNAINSAGYGTEFESFLYSLPTGKGLAMRDLVKCQTAQSWTNLNNVLGAAFPVLDQLMIESEYNPEDTQSRFEFFWDVINAGLEAGRDPSCPLGRGRI